MSQQVIRGALQTRLKTLGWADQTAWENRKFTPTAGVPYQRVTTLFAEPNNLGLGETALERGVFQVTLAYPVGSGIGASTARAEAIRDAFPKNLTIDGKVKVARAPEITRLGVDKDEAWDITTVRIRFVER